MLASLIASMFLQEGQRPPAASDFLLEDTGGLEHERPEAPTSPTGPPPADAGGQRTETQRILAAMGAVRRDE